MVPIDEEKRRRGQQNPPPTGEKGDLVRFVPIPYDFQALGSDISRISFPKIVYRVYLELARSMESSGFDSESKMAIGSWYFSSSILWDRSIDRSKSRSTDTRTISMNTVLIEHRKLVVLPLRGEL